MKKSNKRNKFLPPGWLKRGLKRAANEALTWSERKRKQLETDTEFLNPAKIKND